MSKKHFIALADAIKTFRKVTPGRQGLTESEARAYDLAVLEMTDAIAGFCMWANGRFMRDRWIGYIQGECGPNGGTIKAGK